MKRPNTEHRSTSGTKRKKEDSNQSFEIINNGPETDSGVEEQPKLKKTKVLPADAGGHGRAYVLKGNNH